MPVCAAARRWGCSPLAPSGTRDWQRELWSSMPPASAILWRRLGLVIGRAAQPQQLSRWCRAAQPNTFRWCRAPQPNRFPIPALGVLFGAEVPDGQQLRNCLSVHHIACCAVLPGDYFVCVPVGRCVWSGIEKPSTLLKCGRLLKMRHEGPLNTDAKQRKGRKRRWY